MSVKRRVQVRNVTQETIVAERAILAESFWELLLGLIPYPVIERGEGMVIHSFGSRFTTSIPGMGSIHTSFLRYPIDVLFLNRDERILRICKGVLPFRIAWAPAGTRAAVEAQAGAADLSRCQPGDQLAIEEL